MSTVTKFRPKQALRLHCSDCGAEAEATCDCGVGYLSASEFAAKAVAKHPEMSNRSIAENFGLGRGTVDRARQAAAPNGAPRSRTGLDGKQHPTERRQQPSRVPAGAPIEAPAIDDADRIEELTSAQQDQILHLMLRLLNTVDHKHRKKFKKHLDQRSIDGVYIASCGNRGWASGGYAVDAAFLSRVLKGINTACIQIACHLDDDEDAA